MHLSPDAKDVDHRVADLMSSFWVSFAEDFDPNGPGLPEWDAWNRGDMRYLEFGSEAAPGEGLIREAAAFYDALDPEIMVRRR